MAKPGKVPKSITGLLLPSAVVVIAVTACSIYANLSYLVTDPEQYQYFPPFQANVNGNHNQHLGAEYLNIAKAMVAGEGFSNPFGDNTGPTAWMPPVLPALLAVGLLCTGGNITVLTVVFVIIQDLALIATGLLCVSVVYQVSGRAAGELTSFVFVFAILCQFRLCFQITHDCWLVLLTIDGLIAGLCWCKPLGTWKRIMSWGLYGGLCALVNPIVAATWAILTFGLAVRQKKWTGLMVTALCSILVVAPWTVRNYIVFGKWMPVKSNAMYELYQSMCLQSGGLLSTRTFSTHPYGRPNQARYDYARLGEMEFINTRAKKFWQAVKNDPMDFVDRVAQRFFGATLWYVPMNRQREPQQLLVYWANRISHPIPFIALIFLLYSSLRNPLTEQQWQIIAIYICYLSPYILVSYYDRYALPLIGVKVILISWATDRLLRILIPTRKKRKKIPKPV